MAGRGVEVQLGRQRHLHTLTRDTRTDDAHATSKASSKTQRQKHTLTSDTRTQADLDDGWGVVVKSNKGRIKTVLPGQPPGGGGEPGGM